MDKVEYGLKNNRKIRGYTDEDKEDYGLERISKKGYEFTRRTKVQIDLFYSFRFQRWKKE